jgi:ATP-dependent Lon protease
MSLDSRIKKLEERYKNLKDSNDENTSSIEDLYDSINNIKSKPVSNYSASDLSSWDKESDNESEIEELSLAKKQVIKQCVTNRIGNNASILEDYKDVKELDINELEVLLEYLYTIYANDRCDNQVNNSPDNYNKIKSQLDYFISLNLEKRKCILDSIANYNNLQIKNKIKPMIFTILESSLSNYHKQIVISKLKMLEQMDSTDSEYYKMKQWLDNLVAIPFGIYKEPTFILTSNENQANAIITNASNILDNAIYGQQRTKQHILEIVAKMISNPSARGSVFAVEGEAGTGKTSLIKRGLAPIFELPFQFISLGGARDMSYLAGENYTYIGSKPGLIVQGLKQAGCMNPIFFFDELDKVSDTPYGQEIINLLIHITDSIQNEHFQDVYLDGIPVDLSQALFVFSFNNRALVNPILLDRMEIITFDKYSYADKVTIIKKYLLPELFNEYFGNDFNRRTKVILEDKRALFKKLIFGVKRIGKGVVKSHGIRSIKRKLEKAIAKINLEELMKNSVSINKIDGGNKKIRKIIIKPEHFDKL